MPMALPVVPDTEQIAGVLDTTCTGNPELAVAPSGPDAPTTTPDGDVNVMVWAAGGVMTIDAVITGAAAYWELPA